MSNIRRHLGAWTMLWLACQVASISALTIFDLTAVGRDAKDCLQAGPAEQCPMHGADGQPCPMHRGTHHDEQERGATCSLRGTSDASGGQLGGLFSLPGVLPSAVVTVIEDGASFVVERMAALRPASISLDTPPPRV
jgi:hypothetical protein